MLGLSSCDTLMAADCSYFAPEVSVIERSLWVGIPSRAFSSHYHGTPSSAQKPHVLFPCLCYHVHSARQLQTWGRRYIALFRSTGSGTKDAIYFFGDSAMCDKMVGQSLHTSHGCFPLSDVTRLQLRQEDSNGGRAIALQTGVTNKGSMTGKEMIIVPEEQREFSSWVGHIKTCCPDSAYTTAANATPASSTVLGGDTPFASASTMDGDGFVVNSVAAAIGLVDDEESNVAAINVIVGGNSVDGDADHVDKAGRVSVGGKGGTGRRDREDSTDYGRTASSDTQPPGGLPRQDISRVYMVPSVETERDSALYREEDPTMAPGSPNSMEATQKALARATRVSREDSTNATDVE